MTLTRTAPAVAPEVVTPLKPSEALRLGRLTRPVRGQHMLFAGPGQACALGAMLAGYGHDGGGYDDLPRLDASVVGCPDGRCGVTDGSYTPINMTMHLNDQHVWSDDQIVAWLESLGL